MRCAFHSALDITPITASTPLPPICWQYQVHLASLGYVFDHSGWCGFAIPVLPAAAVAIGIDDGCCYEALVLKSATTRTKTCPSLRTT